MQWDRHLTILQCLSSESENLWNASSIEIIVQYFYVHSLNELNVSWCAMAKHLFQQYWNPCISQFDLLLFAFLHPCPIRLAGIQSISKHGWVHISSHPSSNSKPYMNHVWEHHWAPRSFSHPRIGEFIQTFHLFCPASLSEISYSPQSRYSPLCALLATKREQFACNGCHAKRLYFM